MKKPLVVLIAGAAVLSGCARKRHAITPAPAEAPVAPAAADGPGAAGHAAAREGAGTTELERWSASELSAAWAVLQRRVFFEFDQSTLGGEAQRIVDQKADILRAHPAVRLRITGHADERGSTEYNLALGMRRAASVREGLEAYGLDGRRFEVASMGEEEPLDPGSAEAAYARNRRAEFTVLSGLPAPARP